MAISYYYRAYGEVIDVNTGEKIYSGVTIKFDENTSSVSNTAPLDGYSNGYFSLTSSQERNEDCDLYFNVAINDPLLQYSKIDVKVYDKNSSGSPTGTIKQTFTSSRTSGYWDAFDVFDSIGGSSSNRMPLVFTVYVARSTKRFANVMFRAFKSDGVTPILNAAKAQLELYDGVNVREVDLTPEEFVKVEIDVSSGKCFLGAKTLEINPTLSFGVWQINVFPPNTTNTILNGIGSYENPLSATSSNFDIFSYLMRSDVTETTPLQIYCMSLWYGEPTPDWEPSPPYQPPSGGGSGYLAFIKGSDSLCYTPSGRLAFD